MVKLIKAFFFLLLSSSAVFGQTVTISGYITDKVSGERIGDVYIISLPGQKKGVSNDFGYYSIDFEKSEKQGVLIFSNISYMRDTVLINFKNDTVINVKLTPGHTLEEINITADKEEPIEQKNETGVLNIPIKQIYMLPALGGENDIIKAYQLMPGIQSGNEGSSNLLVRGGSNDQNLILIDDVPLYSINHLGGFVSVFNSDAVKSTKLYKGGFPARYGGHLSSVFDVRMKEGNYNKFGGNASLGLISARFMSEGPLTRKKKSSYLVSYRRFFYDLFMRPITYIVNKNNSSGYFFHDFNLKLNYTFNNKDKIYLSMYFGDDKFTTTYKEKIGNITELSKFSEKWGNFLTAARWNHLFGNKLFGNFTLYYTRYRFKTEMNSKLKQKTTKKQKKRKKKTKSVSAAWRFIIILCRI